MAEGKSMYHCSLALRLMSCTLVGNPMVEKVLSLYLVIWLDITIQENLEHCAVKMIFI